MQIASVPRVVNDLMGILLSLGAGMMGLGFEVIKKVTGGSLGN